MMKVKVDTDAVMKKMRRMVSLAGDLRPVLLQLLGNPGDKNPMTVIGGINQTFVTQGGSTPNGWRPLSKRYEELKAKKYPGSTMLIGSGRMYRSLVGSEAETVKILTNRGLTYGTVVPYAGYHQSTAARSKLPRRPFLDVLPIQRATWNKLIAEYLEELTGAVK